MKKILFLSLFLLNIAFVGFSQTIPPPYINYQAVLYDVNGANPNSPLTNQSFSTFVNINDELGNLLYREEHYASTDANGLITVKMGDGLYTAGPITNFNQINWGVGKYYLVVDFVINGTTSSTAPEQLVTVPYSFYAGKAGNGMTAVADNGNGTLTFTYANGATYTTPTLAGIQGPVGPVGPSGASGTAGTDGQSAYDLWLAQGNTGTVQDFLSTSAYQIWLAQGNTGTAQDFLNTLVGPSGPQGIQGIPGTNGLNTVVKTSPEAVGSNCAAGGTKLEYGLDANNNGALDAGEINNALTKYICNGANGVNGPSSSGLRIGFSSSTTWTCPVGVTTITVELWGGAGGGGGGSFASTGPPLYGCLSGCNAVGAKGGNGGNGGYIKSIISVTSGQVYNIIIGNGGAGGNAGTQVGGGPGAPPTNGGIGGNSSFDGTVIALGGQNGTSASSGLNTCSPGINGSNGIVTNYTPIGYPIQGLTSPRNYLPTGYVNGTISASCCSSGGPGGAGGNSSTLNGNCMYGYQSGFAGSGGEAGYCVIVY